MELNPEIYKGNDGGYYVRNFTCRKDVEESFEVTLDDDVEIIIAWYGYGSYDGSAFVVGRDKSGLFHVSAGHCSCYGLEGQWGPVRTTVEQIIVEAKEMVNNNYTEDENIAGRILLEIFDPETAKE